MKRFVKGLYDLRSAAFHGNADAVSEDPRAVEQARKLAQAVLIGTMRWQWHQGFVQPNETPRRISRKHFQESLDKAGTCGDCLCDLAHILTHGMDLTSRKKQSK